MKSKTVKTLLNQLIKQFGSIELAAINLGISTRYTYMLLNKQRKAGKHLRKFMQDLLEK